MISKLLTACFFVALCRAQVNSPRVGFVRGSDGFVRQVLGVTGSFIVSAPLTGSGSAASFSNLAGIVATDGHLLVFQADGALLASEDAETTDAVVHIDNSSNTAIAWLPNARTLLRFDGSVFHRTELPARLPGRVLSMRVISENTAAVLVWADEAVTECTVSLKSGNLISQRFLPGVAVPASYTGESIVFQRDGQIDVLRADGNVRTLAFTPSVTVMESMANGMLHILTASSHQEWVLDVSKGGLRVWELPSAPPASASVSGVALPVVSQ